MTRADHHNLAQPAVVKNTGSKGARASDMLASLGATKAFGVVRGSSDRSCASGFTSRVVPDLAPVLPQLAGGLRALGPFRTAGEA